MTVQLAQPFTPTLDGSGNNVPIQTPDGSFQLSLTPGTYSLNGTEFLLQWQNGAAGQQDISIVFSGTLSAASVRGMVLADFGATMQNDNPVTLDQIDMNPYPNGNQPCVAFCALTGTITVATAGVLTAYFQNFNALNGDVLSVPFGQLTATPQ